MKKIEDYRNSSGLQFSITVRKISFTGESDCWPYAIEVVSQEDLEHSFRVLIKKKPDGINSEAHADIFILDEPVTAIKRELDLYNDGYTEMSFIDTPQWCLIP